MSRKQHRQQTELAGNLMKMNDFDIDELLECADENIQNHAFFASSVSLMRILDSSIFAIDDRLVKKKSRILPSAKNSNAVLEPHQQHLFSQKCH